MAGEKNGTLELIAELRTTHGDFSEKDIGEDDLRAILEAATRAASASNQQSYSIIVLEDRGLMRELTGYSGSRALVFCADGNRLGAASRRLGHGGGEGGIGMESFMTWSVDALLAAQTACIAASSLGIDSMFTNGIGRKGIESAYRALGLPEWGCYPIITLMLGYASGARKPRRGRWAGAGLVHYGRYAPPSESELDEMIAAYDDESRAIGMTRDFREQGFERYLDWHFVKWMGGFPRGSGDAAAERMRKSGFLDR